jgi:hypothetical protein
MSDDTTATTDTNTTATTSTENTAASTTQVTQTQAVDEKKFSQKDVDRIVGDRIARERQARGQTESTNTKTTERKPTTEAERMDRIEQDNAFYRGLARTGAKLDEGVETDLLDLFRVHKPERPGEWITERVSRFGLDRAATQAATTTTNTTSAATTAATAQATDATKTASTAASTTAPSKVGRIDSGQLIDVSTLTGDELVQLGTQGVREHLERVINAGQARDGRPPVPAVLRPKR